MALTYETYEAADLARESDETHMVCGVRLEDGSDRYFVLPRDIPDEKAYEIAFEIRNGRPITDYEHWLRSMVHDRHEELTDA